MQTYEEVSNYYKERYERELVFGLDSAIGETIEIDGYSMRITYDITNGFRCVLQYWPIDLEVLVIPDIVTDIVRGYNKELNTNLKEVVFNKHCRKIVDNVFADCVNLSKVNIENIEYIGKGAFRNCHSLSDITFSDKLTWLGARAFAHTNIKSLEFKHNLDALHSNCFAYCRQLETVKGLSCDTIEVGRISNQGIHTNIFRGCDKLKEVEILRLDNLTDNFFWHCSSLDRVIIRGPIMGFKEDVFYGCKDIIDIVYNDKTYKFNTKEDTFDEFICHTNNSTEVNEE